MKNKKIYRAVVVGCGNIGAGVDIYNKNIRPGSHADTYLKNKRIELCALVKPNKLRHKYLKKYYPGVDIYTDAEKMISEVKIDILSIAVPTNNHFELVMLAVKNKIPVILCEKPLSHSLKEAKIMVEECQKKKIKLFVNHIRRYDKLMIKWSKKVRDGLLGKLEQATFQYYNGLYNSGTHFLDLIIMFAGQPVSVIAIHNKNTSWNKKDMNVDGLLFFKNGLTLSIQSLSKNYGYQNIKIFGEKGMLEISNLTYEIKHYKKIKNKNFKNFYQLEENCKKEGKEKSWMVGAINYFVKYMDGKEKIISTGNDGLIVMKILNALRKSASSKGKLMKINY